MNIVTAESEMLERILDGTFEIWNEGLSRSAYGQWNRAQLRTPWARHRLQRFVALDERERVLATAKQYRFDVRVGGREGWMCGIGAVFTPTGQRGKGHASTLIEQLTVRAQRDGALLASLFSGQFIKLMARLCSHMSAIEKAIGVGLVLTGILFLTGGMPRIAGRLLEAFPVFGSIG